MEKTIFTAKDLKVGVVYKYTCPEGKIYIGQTYNERNRKSQHKNETTKDTNSKFGQALLKYGYENFKYEVIIKFNPTLDLVKLKRVLNKLERRYIKLYNSIENGYNLVKGGEGVLGLKHSDETKEKFKNRIFTEETRKKISEGVTGKNKGRVFSEEVRKKNSDSRTNKKRVIQLELDGTIINTFSSINDAADSIENSTATKKTKNNRISDVCNGRRKLAYDFIWKFEE